MKRDRLFLTMATVLFLAGLTLVGCSEQAQRVLVPTADTQIDQQAAPFGADATGYDIGEFVETQYDFAADAVLEVEEEQNQSYDKNQQDPNGGDSETWKDPDPA